MRSEDSAKFKDPACAVLRLCTERHVIERSVFHCRTVSPAEHTDCVPVTELRQPVPEGTLRAAGAGDPTAPGEGHPAPGEGGDAAAEDFLEFFLNFHFSRHPGSVWKPSVNGVLNVRPKSPPQVQL